MHLLKYLAARNLIVVGGLGALIIGESALAATREEVSAAPAISGDPLYTAQSLRDPMKSLLPQHEEMLRPARDDDGKNAKKLAKTPMPVLELQGVLWGGPKPSAIINSEVYGVGEAVKGVIIKSVDRTGVKVEFQGQVLTLTPKGG
ncbi:MAG: hypothetical protein HY737_02530 [Candidatus Omnitrophica bacterium]|nr:hypothetical protein [Candidatus Omnitrophota bacterium]